MPLEKRAATNTNMSPNKRCNGTTTSGCAYQRKPFGSQECRHFLSHPLLDEVHGLDVPRIVGVEHGGDDVFERVDDHAMGEQVILTALPDIIETALMDLLHDSDRIKA